MTCTEHQPFLIQTDPQAKGGTGMQVFFYMNYLSFTNYNLLGLQVKRKTFLNITYFTVKETFSYFKTLDSLVIRSTQVKKMNETYKYSRIHLYLFGSFI